MCLILFAYQQHPEYPLIIAANRDEYYHRATRGPHFWSDRPQIFAGRDLQAGGTWMGVTPQGRFAAVTNYREGEAAVPGKVSRGELCRQFLEGDTSAAAFFAELAERKDQYAGFNLLTGDFGDPEAPHMGYFSNRAEAIDELPAGIHGLSNGPLNTAWPKVRDGKQALEQALREPPEALQQILLDDTPAATEELPDTGIDPTLEAQLSSRFIHTDGYGTRSSTVMRIHVNGTIEWREQQFDATGRALKLQRFEIVPEHLLDQRRESSG